MKKPRNPSRNTIKKMRIILGPEFKKALQGKNCLVNALAIIRADYLQEKLEWDDGLPF